MTENMISELDQQLENIDIDSIKLDAIIRLKTWQKKMISLIEHTYAARLHEIDSLASTINDDLEEKRIELVNVKNHDDHNKGTLIKLQHEIDALKCGIEIQETIHENFDRFINGTVRVKRDGNENDYDYTDDDYDVPVIVELDKHEGKEQVVVVVSTAPVTNQESRMEKVFKSEPVQHALAIGLARTLTHMGTAAAASTTTIAATTMAKTALIATACGVGTVAYGMGRIAMGTTRRVWSLLVSSDD